MQSLTAPPRQNLTRDQVLALLTSPSAVWDAGAEVLGYDLSVRSDISPAVAAATVKRAMSADVHGTCTFTTRQELSWGDTLVRLFTTVQDTPTNPSLKARFNAGVFAMVTPQRKLGTSPALWDVTGYDRLYLLKRQVGDTYTVPADAYYLDAIRAAITASGLSAATALLDSSAAAKKLPAAMTWPLLKSAGEVSYGATGDAGGADSTEITTSAESGPTTWLRVINDLLAAIGYRGLWCDESGYFRSEPYVRPANRASEWTLRIGGIAKEVHAAIEAQVTRDEWGLPNRWIFVLRQSLNTPTEGFGQYTVTDADGVAKRGGLVWPVQVDLDAADQASLVTQGDARVAADKRVATTIVRETRPFPAVGHADVMTLVDPELGGTFTVQTAEWTQDLFGGNTSHTWQVVR